MTISNAIRILVADDHAIVRTGFRQFIVDEPDMKVIAEAASGEEVIALVREREIDVVLLDIAMPDKNGIDTLHVIKQIKPRLPVLFLSTYPETQYALILLRAGADGYVTKDASPEEIIRAIRTVSRGHRYVSEVTAGLLMQKLERPTDQAMHDGLSEREFQVFCKLAQGRKPTEIAQELHLSVKTISTYRARVLEKMRLQSNAELTLYALKNGLIQ
ncbi:response regulator transcription factor [Pandoraea sp.]|uniref:response regulator n=1 Tax=Pandoraea sp. TaxID=1883445 RepID=UPI001226D250|nr:response regulator transcription factor [Pandoraea sp.]TAL56506.1 MAG: response regulator transcription factor [Pandoraea sp.]TAM15327.1 MAG: response regulator transcription factor [Pandoraea sp.]